MSGDVRVSTVEADVVEEDPVQERRLRVGAAVAAEAREAVRAASGLRMSAGVAHNKLLAKLAASLHKPDAQTALPASEASAFVAPLPLRALPGVGARSAVLAILSSRPRPRTASPCGA